jgi:subtilisin family serine protease
MAFIYSASGEKIQLTPSENDIGIRFGQVEVARRALRALQANIPVPAVTEALGRRVIIERTPVERPRSFGRLMLIHDLGAAAAPVETVVNALSKKFLSRTDRTYPVYLDDFSGLRVVATEEIMVRFKPKSTEAKRKKLLDGLGLVATRPSEFVPHQFLAHPSAPTFKSGFRSVDLANALYEADDAVELAAPNFVSEHRKGQAPNDPLFRNQWYLNSTIGPDGASADHVRALEAWEITRGGSPDVVIAIVDDGVDLRHPDLKDNLWMNRDPKAADRHGRNFYDATFDPSPQYFLAPYDHLEANDIHGTACAGIAAAVGNNRKGVTGIAYACRILPVKIFGADALAANDRVADSIRYASRHAQVISCSWSAPAANPDLEAALTESATGGRGGRGTLIFCAAGNGDGTGNGLRRMAFPASHPMCWAIGASNDQGKRSRYSNFGKGLELVAPSSDIGRPSVTTTDVSRRNCGFSLGTSYTHEFGGTSSATPLVAGIAALVLSVNPELKRQEVRDLLRSTADKIDRAGGHYEKGWSEQYGYGRVNAAKAVALAARAKPAKGGRKPKPALRKRSAAPKRARSAPGAKAQKGGKPTKRSQSH